MHRSRHKIAAEYELLKFGSSMRRSLMGTRSRLERLCLSMVTGVQMPSSFIFNHAFGPMARGFAGPPVVDNRPAPPIAPPTLVSWSKPTLPLMEIPRLPVPPRPPPAARTVPLPPTLEKLPDPPPPTPPRPPPALAARSLRVSALSVVKSELDALFCTARIGVPLPRA